MRKYKIYMVIIIFLLIIAIGGTIAMFVWESENNAIVNIDVCTPSVYFSGGTTINGSNMVPVLDKESGAKKEIEVRLNKSCDTTALMSLYMKLDRLSLGLQDKTFVYELYKNDEVISRGNFEDKREGDIVEIASGEIISEEVSIYKLYVYIDGREENPDSTQNQTFSFSIYSEGTGAIYKENVIANYSSPTDANSSFLDTDLIRKDIQSVTIAKDNNVPEEAIGSYDVSSKKDGSVMLWYMDADNNNLYEVYIGGENGIVKANYNGAGMFAYLTNAEYLDLSNLDTSSVTTMNSMFANCSKMTSLDLSTFDTSNVTSIVYMFSMCRNLISIDLSSFDTSKVTSMYRAFYHNNNLKDLDLSNFDTSNVISMSGMFFGASKLTSLDVSSFNTTKVKDMGDMFGGCHSLISLDLSNFDTSSVTTMESMFRYCNNLVYLNLSNFNTSKVKNMRYMFLDCHIIKNLDVSMFDTSSVTDMLNMFAGCKNLINLDLSNFDTSKVTNISKMFNNCTSLKKIDLRKADFSSVTSYDDLFFGVSSEVEIHLKDSIQRDWITSRFPDYMNILY